MDQRRDCGLCIHLFMLAVLCIVLPGCATPFLQPQRAESKDLDQVIDESSSTKSIKLVGDLTTPWGMRWQKIEGVALVTQLDGTGTDPPPSPLRAQLEKEMQTHNVRFHKDAMADPDTAMVLVRGFIPPAAEKDDHFDVEVRTPPRSRTKDITGGWLMLSRLREVQMLGGSLREGHVSGLAQGEILVDALFHDDGELVLKTRGRVIGGGVVRKDRAFGLTIRDRHTSVRTSAMIGAAINQRFHHYKRGDKKGVANPRNDELIELAIHPRYKKNLSRYLRVIQNIAVAESPTDRLARLASLENMLMEPTTAERAALQLEGIGQESLAILRKGMASADPEVRFYSAEALAYLEDVDAGEVLYETARDIRAFRWRALAALAITDHVTSQEALIRLMDEESAETRYGAFRALREQNRRDPLVRGEILNKSFALHTIASSGPPMVHLAHARRPEIVLFGTGQRIRRPTFLYAGKHILIKGLDNDRLRVSLFKTGEETKQVECSTQLEDLIRTIAEVGGGYEEILQAITSADQRGFLASRVETNALPRGGRQYDRESANSTVSTPTASEPVPEMFSDRLSRPERSTADSTTEDEERRRDEEDGEETVFGKMAGWFGFGN